MYRGKDRCKELTDMDEKAGTKAIEKWLRMVDKPLAKKEGEKKDAEPRDEWGHTNEQKLFAAVGCEKLRENGQDEAMHEM